MKRALVLCAALVLLLAGLEAALHLFPSLLPRAYLAGFPGHGSEFFRPRVFQETPVEGVLLPHFTATHNGPPPADLVDLGIAPKGVDFDARAFPTVELPTDSLGFPNPPGREEAELVLIGDSFGVAAGALQPEGLQAMLEKATGLRVRNLSVAGIGPVQERWLTESLALPAKPRAVLWLYFSGNDLTASFEPFLARRDGKKTWAEAWPERRRPTLILPDLIAKALGPRPDVPAREPLPGFAFQDRSTSPVWFHPDYLRQLGWSRADWEAHPAWPPAKAELEGVIRTCREQGDVPFFFVYLPSKPEFLLPFVTPAPELARRTIEALGNPAPPGPSEPYYARMLANRGAQEALLRDFCAQESVPFISGRALLEAQAGRGELGYLVTDSHWHPGGQALLIEPLVDALRAQGVIE